MTTFIVRVELHGADAEDYENLHEHMERKGYQRHITADSGNEYQLPDAEYIRVSSTAMNVTRIANEVYEIASSVNDAPGVLVTEAASIEVMGLRPPLK